MLLDPNDKFIKYIHESEHYLNSPKHMFNHFIRSLIRGYSPDHVRENLKVFFKQCGYNISDKKLEELHAFHLSVTEKEFNELNVNDVLDDPNYMKSKSLVIDNYIKSKENWFQGRLINQPSFPFRKRI